MANLSKFHAVFSSSTLIHLDKDAFERHLCQTVNNFVKQNKSSLLSPLKKRHPPNTSSISETQEGNSISEKSKLKIMKLNKFIPEYGFLVLINLLVPEQYHTLK